MLSIALYAILIAHVTAYRVEYSRIGIMFAMTVSVKILCKKIDEHNATLVGVGGGALVILEISKLLKQITKSSFDGTGSTETTKGLIPEFLESLKQLIIK